MNLSNLYYRNPRLLVLTLFIIVVAGLSAFKLLPRLEDPEITQRWAIVVTPFPGADPERVDALVSKKIEEELLKLSEIKQTKVSSRAGISVINVILKDSAQNIDDVWARIRDKLSNAAARMPPGVPAPKLQTDGLRAYTMIAGLSWESSSPVSYSILRRLSENLKDRIREVPGTQFTSVTGDPKEEITVSLKAREASTRGFTVGQLAQAIRLHDSKVSAGQLRDRDQNLLIKVAGQFDNLERIKRIPVQNGQGSQIVPLGEIAHVEKTIENPASELAYFDGVAGIAVSARMEPDKRVDQWAVEVRKTIEDFKKTLPPGLKLQILFDQSSYTDRRLSDLSMNLFIGGLLVVFVVFLMMGWKSALLVGSSLPLSVLMVLGGMRFLDIPMHQMSVTGLIIALGLLIDNAIVVVDEVRDRFREGMSIPDGISDSARHLAVPLLGSTLTTVLAFMPLVLMPGGAGEFVGTIAVTVILALLSSLFLALTVIPAFTGFLQRHEKAGAQSFWNRGLSFPRVAELYRRSLDFIFAHPILGVIIGVILPIAGFVGSKSLDEQFFPQADRDQFQIIMRLPQQASVEKTKRFVLEARDAIKRHQEVQNVHWFVGGNAPMFYYNMVPGSNGSPFYAQALIQLDGPERARTVIQALQFELEEAFPDAQVLCLQLEQGPPFDAPIEARILGPDLDVLADLGEQARLILSEIPNVVATRATLNDGLPILSFQLDEQKAKLVGLQPVEVARQLDRNLEGLFAGSVLEGTEEVPVRVRVEGAERSALNNIESLELLTRGSSGAIKSLPLDSLGTMSVISDRADIPRFNGQRVNTIQAFPKAGTLPQSILKRFLKRLEKLKLPEGYRIVLGGESSERDQAVGSLMASVSLLMVMMAAILVLSFGSFRMAGIIGGVAFLSIGLGLLGLVVFDFPFGFMAIVGTMGLVGVAINDAIVVLAAIRDDPEARSGDPVAIRKVVNRATRHVLSTTLTTMIGFAPLLIAGGGFWPPLAIAIAGGVSGSTLLALTFVPSAYRIVMCQRWFSWIRKQPAIASAVVTAKTESEDREPVGQN